MKPSHFSTAILLACATISANAATFTIDFNNDDTGTPLVAGSVNIELSQPYADLFSPGKGITFTSGATSTNPLNIYDTEGNTGQDTDLERNSGLNGTSGTWSGGNAITKNHGNALIVNRDTNISNPNDNAGGGIVTINLDEGIDSFVFDYIDLDDTRVAGSFVSLFDGGTLIGSIDFADFEATSSSIFSNPGVEFGNHHSNSITSITEANLKATFSGFESLDRITFTTVGSGAIGSLSVTTVPEPSTSVAFALGLLALLGRRHRK